VADTDAEMPKPAPMSNTERQRRFRERHPGYYGRLHRKRRAGTKAMLARQRAEARAKAQAEAEAEAHAQTNVAVVKRVPLMLPAPVIDTLTMELAALAEARKVSVDAA